MQLQFNLNLLFPFSSIWEHFLNEAGLDLDLVTGLVGLMVGSDTKDDDEGEDSLSRRRRWWSKRRRRWPNGEGVDGKKVISVVVSCNNDKYS